jgi:hypothetical protein
MRNFLSDFRIRILLRKIIVARFPNPVVDVRRPVALLLPPAAQFRVIASQ